MSDVRATIQVAEGTGWLSLEHPARVIEVRSARQVRDVVREVERLVDAHGYHAVGYLAYEAGGAFGLQVSTDPLALPVAWFALFDAHHVSPADPPHSTAPYEISELTASRSKDEFRAAFDRIKRYLAEGDTYQVNYTFKLRGGFSGDPLSLFADLTASQRGRHSACLSIGSHTICSASPELFFRRHGSHLEARPMKGTARRGLTVRDDDRRARQLSESAKEQAENIMVVDMVRNDLGRIADVGTVAVPELFALERYPNVWQMTSSVTARSSASLDEVLAALHPSASVTGAPKIRTMEIIKELERAPRGIYTGAIGYLAPNRTAQFSVAIRTAVVDHRAGIVEFGVGSGIVWDSDADAEYAECMLKGSVLGRRPVTFALLETLRWTPTEGFFLLQRHLERLKASARYFDFEYPAARITDALSETVVGREEPLKIRLLLGPGGVVNVERSSLDRTRGTIRVGLAREPIDPTDVFLFHKTTNRRQHERASRPGYDETIMWNPDGLVTEGTISNVVAEIGGQRVTPPVECGLLAGTFRDELLATGEVRESPIAVDELMTASRVWLINSVRGWRDVSGLLRGRND